MPERRESTEREERFDDDDSTLAGDDWVVHRSIYQKTKGFGIEYQQNSSRPGGLMRSSSGLLLLSGLEFGSARVPAH